MVAVSQSAYAPVQYTKEEQQKIIETEIAEFEAELKELKKELEQLKTKE